MDTNAGSEPNPASPMNKMEFDQTTIIYDNVKNPTAYDEWYGLHGKEAMFHTPTSEDRRVFDPFHVITPVEEVIMPLALSFDSGSVNSGPAQNDVVACGICSGTLKETSQLLQSVDACKAASDEVSVRGKIGSGRLSFKCGDKDPDGLTASVVHAADVLPNTPRPTAFRSARYTLYGTRRYAARGTPRRLGSSVFWIDQGKSEATNVAMHAASNSNTKTSSSFPKPKPVTEDDIEIFLEAERLLASTKTPETKRKREDK